LEGPVERIKKAEFVKHAAVSFHLLGGFTPTPPKMEETFETKVRQLLAEAYDLAVSKYKRQAARR
jgi:hypothetical protein